MQVHATLTMDNWRDVKGFEGLYSINSVGEVLSHPRNGTKGGLLKQYTDRYGYRKVVLYKNDAPHYFTVHRLVALNFLKNTSNVEQVNHKNSVRADNRVENLEWVTPKENNHHSHNKGNQTIPMKKVIIEHTKTGEKKIFPSQHEAARYIGVHQSTVHNAIYKKRRVKTAKGYRVQFFEEEENHD